uniref:Uncharacterized protein n=1 Tax=uncultured bacterium contig00039 TaxID=1181527 RepID=A0A806KKU2_9BACT|nr:hypothetical protein [uncultured bacterium contig00039]
MILMASSSSVSISASLSRFRNSRNFKNKLIIPLYMRADESCISLAEKIFIKFDYYRLFTI